MDDEPAPAPRAHTLGDDLTRLSIKELNELKDACLAEAERIAAEIAAKGATRDAAESVFRR